MIKSVVVLCAMLVTVLVTIPIQVYAYTVIEFAVADPPTTYNNVTFTVDDERLDEQYEWLQFSANVPDNGVCCYAKYAHLPHGVANALNDPEVAAQEFEPDKALDDVGYFTVINRTIEPGTPVEMCVSYDANLTKCEDTAVSETGEYSSLIIQVDLDAEKQKIISKLNGIRYIVNNTYSWTYNNSR